MRERPSAEVPKAVMSGTTARVERVPVRVDLRVILRPDDAVPEAVGAALRLPVAVGLAVASPESCRPTHHQVFGLQSMGWNELFSRLTPTQIGTFG